MWLIVDKEDKNIEKGVEKTKMNNFAIKTTNLVKDFGNVVAMDRLNLEIPFGQTYGLLGPNGAGKTTTVRMLNAILRPTAGTAVVGGFDIIPKVAM